VGPGAGADVGRNLSLIRSRIADVAHRSGRDPGSIRLVAVSKTFGADAVRAAAGAGQADFGENRVQEADSKIADLRDLTLQWHLIGHLQSNKARKAAGLFDWIHSVDSIDLLRRIDGAARACGRSPRILLQVDLAGETTKSGAPVAAVHDLARAALDSQAVQLSGLMIIPPIPDDPESSRPWFARLRALRDELVSNGIPANALAELSMGMSQDFEIAIEEGATLVRIGTAIFGSRHSPDSHA
jgi:pyridoxal phosphate enzyme (YggS family)